MCFFFKKQIFLLIYRKYRGMREPLKSRKRQKFIDVHIDSAIQECVLLNKPELSGLGIDVPDHQHLFLRLHRK